MKHIQNQSTPPRGRIRVAALLLAALAGGAVMVVELDVARSLTPVLGGSISVRAIVIITTMLALIPVVVLRPGPGVTSLIISGILKRPSSRAPGPGSASGNSRNC